MIKIALRIDRYSTYDTLNDAYPTHPQFMHERQRQQEYSTKTHGFSVAC